MIWTTRRSRPQRRRPSSPPIRTPATRARRSSSTTPPCCSRPRRIRPMSSIRRTWRKPPTRRCRRRPTPTPRGIRWKRRGMENSCNISGNVSGRGAARALAGLCALLTALPAACAPARPNAPAPGRKNTVNIPTNIITHPHTADADTVAALREMMRRLRDPHASVKALLPHLGRVERRRRTPGTTSRRWKGASATFSSACTQAPGSRKSVGALQPGRFRTI